MKTIKYAFLAVTLLFISACSNSDPVVVNEEELITTLRLTLTPPSGTIINLESVDLDGDGPNPPTISVSGNLVANTTYSGSVRVLNETENPAEDITLEVLDEADEHQFFYTFSNAIATVNYTDSDSNGDPVGVEFTLTTGSAGSGNLTVTLRHEPSKDASGVSSGNIANAGGETDIEVTFTINVQ